MDVLAKTLDDPRLSAVRGHDASGEVEAGEGVRGEGAGVGSGTEAALVAKTFPLDEIVEFIVIWSRTSRSARSW